MVNRLSHCNHVSKLHKPLVGFVKRFRSKILSADCLVPEALCVETRGVSIFVSGPDDDTVSKAGGLLRINSASISSFLVSISQDPYGFMII